MAGASLFLLLDDIAAVLDDVALMTKVAAKKTAGVLGDDLALNAEQVSGVRAERELPVVWAVFKGSAINKLLLVPAALAISAIAPWLVTYLLMFGGLYLCFEGVEKVWHSLAHRKEVAASKELLHKELISKTGDLVKFEKDKIKGAIRTDFVLSAEIIVIALGTVSSQPFLNQVMVVALISTVMTIGVYGLVAFIVKLDDMGIALMQDSTATVFARFKRGFGSIILTLCPWIMKTLSVIGTAAMFLVGGGILVHGIPYLHHFFEHYPVPFLGFFTLLLNFAVGFFAGGILLLCANIFYALKNTVKSPP